MFRAASLAICLLFSLASGLAVDSWGPSDSVHALDGVIAAVNSIVANPHLSPDHLKKAKKLAEDVKADIESVEAGHLTKKQTRDKVGAAMKELSAFAADFNVPSPEDDTTERLQKLEAKLEEKKKALAKTENLMKLLKLKKALAEKKLMLENLMMKKAEGSGGKKVAQDVAETGAAVNKLLALAKNVTVGTKAGAEFKAISATLQAREHDVSVVLTKMVSAQAAGEAQIDAIMKAQGGGGNSDLDAKKRTMVKHLKAEENRKFIKARALKQNEIKELKDAEKSADAHDATALIKVLSKMQRENKQMQAKSGDFLH